MMKRLILSFCAFWMMAVQAAAQQQVIPMVVNGSNPAIKCQLSSSCPIPTTASGSFSSASVGTNNATAPGSSDQIGSQDGSGKLQPASSTNPIPATDATTHTNQTVVQAAPSAATPGTVNFEEPVDVNGAQPNYSTPVGTYPTPQTASTAGIAEGASTSVESGHAIKGSAGMRYDIQVTAGASAGNLMIFNSTTVPGDGAVTPVRCVSVGANTTVDIGASGDPPSYHSTGISVAFSTPAGSAACLTKTASATAFFSWKVQ
jgi:hypothetical protein